MKLIEDIINELISANVPLQYPLLKTKVLASRLKNKYLLDWVNKELEGYSGQDILPEYRKSGCRIVGTFVNGNTQYTNQPIATIGLDPEIIQRLTTLDLYESVGALESLIKDNTSSEIEIVFLPEITKIIENNLRRNGNPYLAIISAKRTAPISTIILALNNVQSKLLDFMLKIDEEFGNVSTINELSEKNDRITHMAQNIINNGNGMVVNTGNNSSITSTIVINKGDKDSLTSKLKENGLLENDISELMQIIDVEKTLENSGNFGPQTNSWIQKMLGKALDGSWQISIGAAGSLLAEALKAYYN